MKTIAEQIAALEAARQAKAARMTEVLQKSMDEGRSTDVAEQEEFDTLEAEVAAIDADLKRFRALEKAQAVAAKPVNDVKTQQEGAEARDPSRRAEIRLKQSEAPGIRFARLAKVRAVSRLENEPVLQVAERMYGGK